MKLKKLFAGILAATMVMAAALPVMADPNDQIYDNQTVKRIPPDVAITKAVAAPAGTDVSAIGERTYTFTFTQIAGEYDADGDAGSKTIKSWAPDDSVAGYDVDKVDIASVSATVNPDTAKTITELPEAGRNTQTAPAYAQKRTENGTDYYMMETPNFLGFMDKNTFKPGVYAYEVVEVQPTQNPETSEEVIDADTKYINEYKYSTAKYRMLLYVDDLPDDHADAPGTYIWAMTVVKVEEDGQPIQDDPKDDPTAGGSGNKEGDLSHFQFDNVFKRTKDSKNPQESSYKVQKRVEGVSNLTFKDDILFGTNAQKYQFTVNIIDNPLYAKDTNEYKAQIYRIAESNSTDPDTKVGSELIFNKANNWAQTVLLAHNEYLAFEKLPDGTNFKVKEANYTEDAVAGESSQVGTLNADWHDASGNTDTKIKAYVTTFEGADASPDGNILKAQGQVGEGAGQYRTTLYKNNADKGTTPAGIIMQYLPFVVIIALALVALIAYVLVKGRRRVAR